MADGGRYLKCDICGAVLDRRPVDDWKGNGTFRYGYESELVDLAKQLGWQWDGDPLAFGTKHYCMKHFGKAHD